MRLIDSSSLVVMFSSEAETPTMAATRASWAEKEGGVSVTDMAPREKCPACIDRRAGRAIGSARASGGGWTDMDELRAAAEARRPGPSRRRGGCCSASRAGRRRRATCCSRPATGRAGLPHIGTFGEVARTTMIRRAFETISDIPTRLDLLLRRHGRHAQGAGERAEPGDAARAPAAAADQRARPLRRVRELRGAQQRHAAAVPRHLRLRVRVRERHRVLSLRAVRRGAAARRRSATTRSWR